MASPPCEDLIRASFPGFELRQEGEAAPTMVGHFAVFDEWTEIDSYFEGHFMERIAPGAFRKTFKENRDAIRVLFQHGFDPQVGDKVLGPIEELKEDDKGGYYEVPLIDARYVREDILPGLRAGLYGSSFRFKVMKEEFEEEPDSSEYNEKGLPERTVKEVRLFEFGPVTFPAYENATAGVRSLTDEFRRKDLVLRMKDLLKEIKEPQHSSEEPEAQETPAESTPSDGSRSTQRDYLQEREEEAPWRL